MDFEIYAAPSVRGPRKKQGSVVFLVRVYNDRPLWQKLFRVRFTALNEDGATLLALSRAVDYVRKAAEGERSTVRIRTGCMYVKNGYYWVRKWQQADWVNSKGKPVQNRELWEQLDSGTKGHTVIFEDPDKRTQEQLETKAKEEA